MKRWILGLLVLASTASATQAWNDKGHMVVARFAWKELSAAERANVIQILEKHPHYGDYLKGHRPANIPEDEWVFMRAATWSDWIRGGPASRRAFHRGNWHYTNIPFVQEGSSITPPPPAEHNVVKQITASKLIVKTGSQEDRAVHTCWLFHLVGDIHQPLHCITLFSDDFPEGDRGGNRSLVRIDGRVVQLHSFWDRLLGKPTTLSSIGATAQEIEALLLNTPNAINNDLAAHKTPEEWAQESFELGKKHAYLNGELHPANSDDDPADGAIPSVPEQYAEEAGEIARYCVAKAGKRLAGVIREVIASE